MKKLNFAVIAVLFSLVFSSCSSDEVLLQDQQSKELFKSYQLKRDANGAYSIDVQIGDYVSIGKVKNTTNNTNELYLSVSDDGLIQKNDYGSDLWFNNESFKVELISDNFSKVSSISITDDNIKFAKKDANNFLNEYSISLNEDGSYNLDFDVLNNVSVDFVYNSEENVYEVHLEESGKTQESNSYSKVLEKEEGSLLQIHFVNHIISVAKSSSFSELMIRKPKVIIDDSED